MRFAPVAVALFAGVSLLAAPSAQQVMHVTSSHVVPALSVGVIAAFQWHCWRNH